MMRSYHAYVLALSTASGHMLRILATSWVLALWFTPAIAQVDPARLAAAQKAGASFSTLAAGYEQTGEAPRASEAAVNKLLDTIFDATDVDVAKPVSFAVPEAMIHLGERVKVGVQIGSVYLLAGTGQTDSSQLDSAGRLKMRQNMVRFAPEMGRFFDFQLRLQRAIGEGMLVRANAKPDEMSRPNIQGALEQTRGGLTGFVSSLLVTLTLDDLSNDWRRDRLTILVLQGPLLAKFLDPFQRAQLQQGAINTAHGIEDAELKEALLRFGKVVGAD